MGKNTALVTNTCRTLSAKNYGRAHEIGHCIERIQLRLTFTSASREVGWTGTSRWVSKHARSPILAILVRFSKKTNILDWKTRNMWTVFFDWRATTHAGQVKSLEYMWPSPSHFRTNVEWEKGGWGWMNGVHGEGQGNMNHVPNIFGLDCS